VNWKKKNTTKFWTHKRYIMMSHNNTIVESVDSIGIAQTCNIWWYKKSLKSQTFMTTSLNVFMTNKTPSGVKRHHESTEPKSHQTAKYFPFSLFFFRCKVVWLSHDGFFCMKQQLLHDPFALPPWSLTKHLRPTTQELWLRLWHYFLCLCAWMCKNYLATKHNNYVSVHTWMKTK